MKDALTEIADALDTLADISDRMDELAGHNASFWRDAALRLRRLADEPMVADKSEARRRIDSKELIGKFVKTPSRRQGTVKGQVESYVYEVELDTGELVTQHLHDLEAPSPPPKTIQASDQLVVELHLSTWSDVAPFMIVKARDSEDQALVVFLHEVGSLVKALTEAAATLAAEEASEHKETD